MRELHLHRPLLLLLLILRFLLIRVLLFLFLYLLNNLVFFEERVVVHLLGREWFVGEAALVEF